MSAERLSPITSKGDLIVGDSSGNASRLALGTQGQIPYVDTNAALGISWGSVGAGGGGVALSGSNNSITSGTASFVNANGVSWSFNGQSISASVQTNYQSTGNYLTTAAQSNQVVNSVNGSTGQISFATGSSLSSSQNGSTITWGLASNITTALQSTGAYLTTAAQSNQVVNSINGSTGTFSFNTGSSLSSSRVGNAITWGLASNITTALQSTGAYLTTAAQTFSVQDSATTLATVNRIAFSTGNNITLSLSTGASSVTVGVAHNLAGTSTGFTGGASISGSFTHNSSGLAISLSHPAWITTAALSGDTTKYIQNWKLTGNTSGTTSSAQGTDLWFSGGNNITISGSSNSIVVSAIASSLLSGGNFITISTNGSTISIIGASVGAAPVNFSAGTTSGNLGSVIFSNSNNATFGLNGSTVTVSSPISISAGTTNGNFTNIVFSNSNGISFGLSGSTITASATGDTTASYYMWPDGLQYVGTSSTTFGNSSMNVQPFIIRNPISGSYIRHLVSLPAFGSSTQAVSASTVTADRYATFFANIFTLGTGGSSKSLQQLFTVTAGMTQRWMWSISNAGTNQSIVWQITYPKEGFNTNNAGTSYSITSANINWSTTGQHTNFTGLRWLDLPFASTLTPGAYWMLFQRSTSSATTGGNFANTTGLTSNMTVIQVTQASINAGQFGVAIGSTDGLQLGLGIYSTNASGGTTNSISLGGLSTQANQPIIPFQIIREA